MRTLAATGTTNTAIICPLEGVSEDSQRISAIIRRIEVERRKTVSFSWRDSLLADVRDVLRTCSEEGWDGYDADPIAPESAHRAPQLIELLPGGIQLPSIVPEATGDLSLEWRKDNQRHFTLSLTGPTLVYAGIFGGSTKSYGEERFLRELPQPIVEILHRYFSEA